MASTKRRLEKLEQQVGGQSGLHFLLVIVNEGESDDQALDRELGEKGVDREELGQALFFQRGLGLRTKNYNQFESVGDLIGYDNFWGRLYDTIRARGLSIKTVAMARVELRGEATEKNLS